MTTRIICAGHGGQGVLTLGNVIADIGMRKGNHVTWMPSYGPEMRGGTSNCSVIISDKMIGSPMVQNKIDVLVAMNQPSVDKFLPLVKPGGLALINTSIADEAVRSDDVKIIKIDATNIAIKAGNARIANMVMLSGFLKETDLFTMEDVIEVLESRFATRNPQLIPLNIEAIKMGM